jgi:hypothetical protein
MSEMITVIKDIGFPIFIATWLLVKDSKEKELTRQALTKLTETVQFLSDKLK